MCSKYNKIKQNYYNQTKVNKTKEILNNFWDYKVFILFLFLQKHIYRETFISFSVIVIFMGFLLKNSINSCEYIYSYLKDNKNIIFSFY